MSQIKKVVSFFLEHDFDGLTFDIGSFLGSQPEMDSYLLKMTKRIKEEATKMVQDKGKPDFLVAITVFIAGEQRVNPLKGIHLNTWD